VFLSVTDPDMFEKPDPYPDPHQSEKLDPDRHHSSSRVQNNGVPDAFGMLRYN
jgi:hypothetical protein